MSDTQVVTISGGPPAEARRQLWEFQLALVPVLAILGALLLNGFADASPWLAVGVAACWAAVAIVIGQFMWRRLRPRLAKRVVLLTTVATGLLTGLLFVVLTPTPPQFHTNRVAMRTTRARLASVRAELDALPAYPGTQPGGSANSGCSEDSGDVFQPSASRLWRIADAKADLITVQVAKDLGARGWQGNPTPNNFGDIALKAEHSGWTASAAIYRTAEKDPAVVVYVTASDPKPCTK